MKALLVLPVLALTACGPTYQAPARVLKPVEKCGYVQVPEYGILDRPASSGEVVGGAVIGGVIGKTITGDDGGAIVGAIIGGATANNRKQEQVIIGYKKVYQCNTVYE